MDWKIQIHVGMHVIYKNRLATVTKIETLEKISLKEVETDIVRMAVFSELGRAMVVEGVFRKKSKEKNKRK